MKSNTNKIEQKEMYDAINKYVDAFGITNTSTEFNINYYSLRNIRENKPLTYIKLLEIYEKITGQYYTTL